MSVIVNGPVDTTAFDAAGAAASAQAAAIAALGGNGRVFFVDSVTGNNGNNGLSPATAWATISALPTIQEFDVIMLARGSHWREQLSITAENVTVRAYGAGDRPHLDASNIVPSFTKTGGQTNVYQFSVTLTDVLGSASYFLLAWEDGDYLMYENSIANCDANPGTFYTTSSTGAVTVYVHPFGSTNPTSDGKTYEYSHRNYGMVTGANNVIEGICTSHNRDTGGSIRALHGTIIRDHFAKLGGRYAFFIFAGCEVYDSIVEDSYGWGNAQVLLHIFDTEIRDKRNIIIDNVTLRLNKAPIGVSTGVIAHASVVGNNEDVFGTVRITNCTCEGLVVSISTLSGTQTVIIENFTQTNCRSFRGQPYAGNSPPGFMGFIRKAVIDTGDQVGPQIFAMQGTGRWDVSGVHATTGDRNSQGYIQLTDGVELHLRDSIIDLDTAYTYQRYGVLTDANSRFYGQNNRWVSVNGWDEIYSFAAIADWQSDQNYFSHAKWKIGATTYTTLLSYQQATGKDKHPMMPVTAAEGRQLLGIAPEATPPYIVNHWTYPFTGVAVGTGGPLLFPTNGLLGIAPGATANSSYRYRHTSDSPTMSKGPNLWTRRIDWRINATMSVAVGTSRVFFGKAAAAAFGAGVGNWLAVEWVNGVLANFLLCKANVVTTVPIPGMVTGWNEVYVTATNGTASVYVGGVLIATSAAGPVTTTATAISIEVENTAAGGTFSFYVQTDSVAY